MIADLDTGAGARRRRGRARGGPATSLRLVGQRPDQALRRDRGPGRAAGREASGWAAPARLRLHAGGPEDPADAARRAGQGADRVDGQRRLARRLQRAGAIPFQLLQAALRAGHQPGDRLGAGDRGDVVDHPPRRQGAAALPRPGRLLPDRDRRSDPHATTTSTVSATPTSQSWRLVTIDATWPL